MKLFYWKNPSGALNFGDELNELIWNHFLGEILDEDENTTFVGIGTLINHYLPNRTSSAKKRIIFSTGVGYGDVPTFDKSYDIRCVRGPLSAKKLGIDPQLAITDGALLIQDVYSRKTSNQRYQFSYMPHYKHATDAWKMLCHDIGFGYIDPRSPVESVLNKISSTDILLTEAMHGAIVADALRVPWVPIVSGKGILRFKWEDWCQAMELAYEPQYIENPLQLKPRKQDAFIALRRIKCSAQNAIAAKRIQRELIKIANHASPILSSQLRSESLAAQLKDKIEILKVELRCLS